MVHTILLIPSPSQFDLFEDVLDCKAATDSLIYLKMSLTVEQLLTDARRLSTRLKVKAFLSHKQPLQFNWSIFSLFVVSGEIDCSHEAIATQSTV